MTPLYPKKVGKKKQWGGSYFSLDRIYENRLFIRTYCILKIHVYMLVFNISCPLF